MKPLTIVGKGPQNERALLDMGTGRTIWAMSTVFERLKNLGCRVDLIFQLHDPKVFEPWISSEQERVALIQPFPGLEKAKVIPAQKLVDKHGFKFAGTVCWMLALAIEEGFDDINIHGVHQAHYTEYGSQRDAFFYFYGFAEARGIRVNVSPDTGIFIGNQKYGVQ